LTTTEVTVTAQDRWIELRGLKFHYREWSARGAPLVLLHGLASQSHIFDWVAPRLAEHFRVVALDQRGHGESAKPDAGYDFDHIVADLLAFLDALKFKRAIILGHSWGGNVALQFAATHPTRTAALILLDGGFIDMQSDPQMTWSVAAKRLAPPRLAGTPIEQFQSMLKSHLGARWAPELASIILYNFKVAPDQTIHPHLSFEHHMQILRALWEQRPPQLYPRVQCPVLMLPAWSDARDARERAFLAAKRRNLALARQLLAQSETVWFAHTIHDVPLQRPRKLANVITRFARNLSNPTRRRR
jgi:pimeloyl-ACP methyl ester carboxylesterase